MTIKGPKRFHVEIRHQYPLEGYDFVESFFDRELAEKEFVLLSKNHPHSHYRIIQVLSES